MATDDTATNPASLPARRGNRLARRIGVLVAAATLLSAGAGTASASTHRTERNWREANAACAAPEPTDILTTFGDEAPYAAVPGGDFERKSPSWQRTGAAFLGGGDNPLVGSRTGDALRLSLGGTATSPAMCTKWLSAVRFFVEDPGIARARLIVTATVQDVATGERWTGTAVVESEPARRGWRLTDRLGFPEVPGRFGADGVRVQISLSSSGSPARWTIDDVVVDPVQEDIPRERMPFKPR
jgi:hypothetical protein